MAKGNIYGSDEPCHAISILRPQIVPRNNFKFIYNNKPHYVQRFIPFQKLRKKYTAFCIGM